MIHLYVKLFTGIIESFTITPLKIIELKYLRYSIHQGNLVHKYFCTEFIDYLLRLIKLVSKPNPSEWRKRDTGHNRGHAKAGKGVVCPAALRQALWSGCFCLERPIMYELTVLRKRIRWWAGLWELQKYHVWGVGLCLAKHGMFVQLRTWIGVESQIRGELLPVIE